MKPGKPGAEAASARKQIRTYNRDREPQRLERKLSLMRDNLFSFYRGSCHLFTERLAATRPGLDEPLAWSSGDLHIENFGSYRGDNGLVYFDINDFDEAALAPVSWEIIRLGSSILIAASTLQLAPKQAHALVIETVRHYLAALRDDQVRWLERETAKGAIRDLLRDLKDRSSEAKLSRRTQIKRGQRELIIDNIRALEIAPRERKRVEALMAKFAATQKDATVFKVRDVARRVAGTGSLGLSRWIILAEGGHTPETNLLLDLKMIAPSCVAAWSHGTQPQWTSDAHRVVGTRRRCQAAAPAFLNAIVESMGQTTGEAFVLRELQPTEDRLDLAKVARSMQSAGAVFADMARLAAWAQLRASGRDGAAVADGLIAFATHKTAEHALVAAAIAMARQSRDDWRDYCEAWDQGYFKKLLPAD